MSKLIDFTRRVREIPCVALVTLDDRDESERIVGVWLTHENAAGRERLWRVIAAFDADPDASDLLFVVRWPAPGAGAVTLRSGENIFWMRDWLGPRDEHGLLARLLGRWERPWARAS